MYFTLLKSRGSTERISGGGHWRGSPEGVTGGGHRWGSPEGATGGGHRKETLEGVTKGNDWGITREDNLLESYYFNMNNSS